METITFHSQKELLERIMPALKSKKKILDKTGYRYIEIQDIWDALRYLKWKDKNGLMLCDMVDDILHAEPQFLAEYYHQVHPRITKPNIDNLELPKLKE